MPRRERDRGAGENGRPAEGERSAVVGLSGQYRLAARIVHAKLATLEWIRVADPEAGVADDFQFQAGPTRNALQVKWAQYPSSFGWGELVNPAGHTPPLIARLAQARQRIRTSWAGPLTIHLRSNEHASTAPPPTGTPLADCTAPPPRHFAAFLARSFVPVREQVLRGARRWAEVETLSEVALWRQAWDALREATGLGGDSLVEMIGDLLIHFGPPVDDPLLRPDETPTDSDIEHLAATLQALVADPARPLELTRAQFLDRLGWANRLRYRHPHAFPVPTIYAANEAARHQLQERLQELPGGYICLVGPAGAGKSTLLASLTWPAWRVVRYYAFVPDAPDPLSGRGEADSFLHDISLALEESGLHRSGYGNDLRGQRAVFYDQLDQAGQRWREGGEATIIIADGLDHIPREQQPSRSLLEELPSPAALPDGVFVILGTQTTAILPAPIRDALAGDTRTVDLPPLSAVEVLQLADAAGPGDWLLPGQRERLVRASEGHPLALTYIIQELTSMELSEPELSVRRLAADGLLEDASRYGREVEARYRGYLLAAGNDPELIDLLGTVSRLRAPIDLQWLSTWVAPRVLDEFERRTATFFRRDGSVWRFIHNSFRRFLIDETAHTAGEFDPARDRAFHVALADACANSGEGWPSYRDEEVAHRYLAGQHERVIELATPARLRAALVDVRPPAAVRDHALLALRAAAATDNHGTYLRMLIFLNELWQREYVLNRERLATTLVKLGPPTRALEHIVSGGQLRVPAAVALQYAGRLARYGHFATTSQILRAVGAVSEIVERGGHIQDREAADAVANWAEATFHLSGLEEVLAQLDDQLPLPTPRPPPGEQEEPSSADDVHWEAERRRREQEEHDATVVACRSLAHARCFDILSDLREETALSALLDVIDAEAPPAWRARGRVVRAMAALEDNDPNSVLRWARQVIEIDVGGSDALDEADEEEVAPIGRTGVVPLHLRLDAADMLIRAGFVDSPEIDQLVPAGTQVVWPSGPSGQEGLRPFLTLIDLWRLREIRPDSQMEWGQRPPNPRAVGDERFRRALRVLTRMEGEQLAAMIGRGVHPHVAAEADPIVRLLEVPSSQTTDWTGWYAVREAAPGLFQRLLGLAAAAGGPDQVARLFDRFTEAWTNPDRVRYWSPQLQQAVLVGALAAGDDAIATRVGDWLAQLDDEIGTRASDVHDRSETWLVQADAWRRTGNLQRADNALRAGIAASFGPGIHDDDRQLVAWLDWLHAARDNSIIDGNQFLAVARTYASRLVAAGNADPQVGEAAERLIELVWSSEPAMSTALAEALCDAGVIYEMGAIGAVLRGAVGDPQTPLLIAAVTVAELMLPLARDRANEFTSAIEERTDNAEAQQALTKIADALEVWSVPEERRQDESPEPSPTTAVGRPTAVEAPTTAHSLLTAMRQASNADDEPSGGWAAAVDRVADEPLTALIARALLDEASRLRLGGEALGGLAYMGARAGLSDLATSVLAESLARAPSYGWIRRYDGGSRLKTFRAALRDRHPALVRLATNDLAGALSTGGISGPILPDDLRQIAEVICGKNVVARAWPDISAYLDVFAPVGADVLDADHAYVPASSPAEAMVRWVVNYLGHPVRPLDFGARRTIHMALAREPVATQRVLVEAIRSGGWIGETALHSIVTSPNRPASLPPDLVEEIQSATSIGDAISRDLARKLASIYQLPVTLPTRRPLPDTYYLALPPLPDRAPPTLDSQGIAHPDPHDPQQMVGPFDVPLSILAKRSNLDEAAVMYRAASIADATDEPWIRGGPRAHAARLKTRGQLHTFRPWAYMAGRRAIGAVLAELLDADMLGRPPTLPAYYLGLIDEMLIHVEPVPLDSSTPVPWRRPDTPSYDVRSWCDETEDAARAYAPRIIGAPAYVLAELSEWCSLEWGKPKETRSVRSLHGESATQLILPPREAWELSSAGAHLYANSPDLDWTEEQLIVHGWELHTDPRWHEWLAIHPAVARHLGWSRQADELFMWRGPEGIWRARSIRRARGQLSHQPPAHAYCAEVWQVVVSEVALTEIRAAFGHIERELEVERELPAQPREGRMEAEQARARIAL